MGKLHFASGDASVVMDARGRVVSVTHPSAPRVSYLAAGGEVAAMMDGRPVAWATPRVEADSDEVETTFLASAVRVVVRHTFAAGWGIRVAVTNLTDGRLPLDRLTLSWVPGPGCIGWALAAGTAGAYSVHPPAGQGPLLGGLLTLGGCDGATGEGLETGPLTLAAHARYVLQWQWDWYPTARAFGLGRHPEIPRRFFLFTGESVAVATDPDAALIVPSGVQAEPVRDQLELTSREPGIFPFELRGARGTLRYDLTWTEPVEAVLVGAAAEALAGPRTPAGVVRLAGIDQALVVQHVLRQPPAETAELDTEVAAEALDLFCARLPEEQHPDSRMISLLVGEYHRTGDSAVLEQAAAAVVATLEPRPGLGIAASEVCLARLLADLPIGPVVEHLLRLAAEPADGVLGTETGRRTPPELALARLEMRLVTLARGSLRLDVPVVGVAALVSECAGLGPLLGAGLPGRPVRPLDVSYQAHVAAVLALLPEPLSAALRSHWDCTAFDLARQARAEVAARLVGRPAGPAHGWLVWGLAVDQD